MNLLQVATNSGALRCRRKFLRTFPGGFDDETYLAWERGYKWTAHEAWDEVLHRDEYRSLLRRKQFGEIAARVVRLESRTNLLFSFEKMAIRDAVRSPEGARQFAEGLYDFIYGPGDRAKKFERWCQQPVAITAPLRSRLGYALNSTEPRPSGSGTPQPGNTAIRSNTDPALSGSPMRTSWTSLALHGAICGI